MYLHTFITRRKEGFSNINPPALALIEEVLIFTIRAGTTVEKATKSPCHARPPRPPYFFSSLICS